MTTRRPEITPENTVQEPPVLQGSYEDAVTLRRWSFLQRTPTQRLEWLVSMLRIAYQTGALKPREPGSTQGHGAE